jgi:type III restriction enzyme
MNITLKPFQKERVIELRQTVAVAQMSWQHFEKKQIISFTAPTGAGKTIMMASFIESMMCGDEEAMMAPIHESIFIWLSDDPELNEQSKLKLMAYCNKLVVSQFQTLDESFRGETLEPGKIYFLNTQKLSSSSKMTKICDGRDFTIWQTIENTIQEYGKQLVLIIDEAHRGAKTNQNTIMQKFINGSESDGLEPLPMVIGMSATIERFDKLAGASLSTHSKVAVSPQEVRESGLLKDRIEIHYPEESVINKNIAVLQAATDEWIDKCKHWYDYTEKQHYTNVCPVFLIQVEPGTGGRVSNTDLEECLREVEKRVGKAFEAGEVVHAFGEKNTLTLNGLSVPYCQPSAINDDRNIKVVLFKEALSTGWDCPRAEAMMSFRVARDSTYIAQLLGRMIRTPLRMRIEVDESLNYVHLYLPNFDERTVDSVVRGLIEEEGGSLPTDIQAIQGGHKTTVILTVKRPVSVHPASPTLSVSASSTQPPQKEKEMDVATNGDQNNTGTATVAPSPSQDAEGKETSPSETSNAPFELIPTKPAPVIEEREDPYEAVKNAINDAGILTYEVERSVKIKNYLRALFDMARLTVNSGMDPSRQEVDKVKNAVVEMIHNYVAELKNAGKYDELVAKALSFKLNTLSVELYKSGQTYESQQGIDLYSETDAGVSNQFDKAEVLLCGEGIGNCYENKYDDEYDDDNACKYDVILFAADEHQQELLHEYAKNEFFRLADKYRPMTNALDEKYRQQYNNLVTQGSNVSKHLFHLPETINVDLDKEGEICTDHLFVNSEGTARFKLKGWEPLTLKEERNHPNFSCWLRNQDRKPWALCIPYKYGDETLRMYPDFIIVRKDDNGTYEYALLEPHRDNLNDNLAKAKGLARYAEDCPSFSRIQMLRKVITPSGAKMLRLDLAKMSIREKVKKCISDADFDTVFKNEGFYEKY